MSQKVVVHYDKPISHSQQQTRWIVRGHKVSAPSIKLLEVKLNPNQPCTYGALIGAYGCVKRLQIRVDGKIANIYQAPQVLPYVLSSNGDNEEQRGVMAVLHSTNNNVIYDQESKLLTLERSLVDVNKAEIRLALLSGWLNAVGVVTSELEIIIDWASSSGDLPKYLCPVDVSAPVTTVNIEAPYLSYEVLENSSLEQPAKVQFVELVPEQFLINAITTSSTQVTSPIIRSNAFNKKLIGKIMFVNTPSSIQAGAPNPDAEALYALFGAYQSVAMKGESFNVNVDGENLLTMLNVSNESTKLAITIDAFQKVQPHAVSLAHLHSKNPVLVDLAVPIAGDTATQLNGFFSYGAVELNRHVNSELSITYQRKSDDNTVYPSLAEALVLHAIGEVFCEWTVEGGKAYL